MDLSFTVLAFYKETDDPLPETATSKDPKLPVHIVSLPGKNLKKIFPKVPALLECCCSLCSQQPSLYFFLKISYNIFVCKKIFTKEDTGNENTESDYAL